MLKIYKHHHQLSFLKRYTHKKSKYDRMMQKETNERFPLMLFDSFYNFIAPLLYLPCRGTRENMFLFLRINIFSWTIFYSQLIY